MNKTRAKLNKEFKRKYSDNTDVSGCDGQEIYDLDFDDIRDLVNLYTPCSLQLADTLETIIETLIENRFTSLRINSDQIDLMLNPILDCVLNKSNSQRKQLERFVDPLTVQGDEYSSLDYKFQTETDSYLGIDEIIKTSQSLEHADYRIERYLDNLYGDKSHEEKEQAVKDANDVFSSIVGERYPPATGDTDRFVSGYVTVTAWGEDQDPPIWIQDEDDYDDSYLDIAF